MLAGCYTDVGAAKALPTLLKASADMTVDMCAQLAYSARIAYTVFAVQVRNIVQYLAQAGQPLASRYVPHDKESSLTCSREKNS